MPKSLMGFAAAGSALMLLAAPIAHAGAFRHPGLLNSLPELQFVKARIKAGEQPWASALASLRADPLTALDRPAHPVADIQCGSYNKPDIGCDDATYDAKAAYGLALLWYFTDDARYAAKSIRYLDAWAAAYRSIGLSNAPLVSGWALPAFANAAELLRHTPSGWSPAKIGAFSDMLKRWVPEVDDREPYASNWIFSLTEAKMAVAIFTDDKPAFDEAVAMWRKRAPTFSYQSGDGPKPRPIGPGTPELMERIWFGQRTFVDGIAQETCRDIGHMLLGVGALIYGAEMAWHQGVDLYGEQRDRIVDLLEFHGAYFNGAEVPEWLCGGSLLLHPTTPFPKGGIRSDNYEMAYNHYARDGLKLPQSAAVALKSRPAGGAGPVSKWETLTHAMLPAGLGSVSVRTGNGGRLRAGRPGSLPYRIDGKPRTVKPG